MTTLLREYPIPSEQKSIAPGTEATLYSRPLPPGFVYDPERKPNIIGPEVAILAYGQDDQRLFITVANRTDQEVSVSAIFVGTIPADMMPSRDPYPYTSMSFVWELRGDNGMGTMIANMDIHRRGLDALDGWSDARIRAKVGKSRQEPGEAGRSLALDILRMMKTWLDTSMAELEKQAQDAPPQTTQTPRTQEGTQR